MIYRNKKSKGTNWDPDSFGTYFNASSWFPNGLENPETRENIFQSGKSGTFEQAGKVGIFTQNTGKVREFYPKYWQSGRVLSKILEKRGNFSQFLFSL